MMNSTLPETLEKWIEEAELCHNFENGSHNKDATLITIEAFNNTRFHSAGRILTLAKALQSALEVLKEKDKMLLEVVGAFEKNYALDWNDLVEARDLKPHLEGLERLE